MKKVLYICPHASMGGAERIVDSLLKFHNPRRYLPRVYVFREGPLVDQWRNFGIQVEVSPPFRFRNPVSFLRAQSHLQEFIVQDRPHLIHSTMAYAHIFSFLPARRTRTPEVWFQHGPVGGWMDRLAGLLPSIQVFFNSEFTQRLQNLRPTQHSRVIYGPVQIPRDSAEEQTKFRYQVREKFKVLPHEKLLLHVGRLDPWKGQELLITAVQKMRNQGLNMKAILLGGTEIGQESYKKKLQDQIQALELSDSVYMPGSTSAVSPFYYAADLYVHSSLIPEPLGLTLLESLAHGTPLVATDAGGPKELLKAFDINCLYRMGDVEALVKRIVQTLNSSSGASDREKRIQFAKNFEAKFWVEGVENLYDKI